MGLKEFLFPNERKTPLNTIPNKHAPTNDAETYDEHETVDIVGYGFNLLSIVATCLAVINIFNGNIVAFTALSFIAAGAWYKGAR